MHPILFQTNFFGLLSEPWSLHTYGLFIALGFLAAMTLVKRQAAREGENPERVVDLAFYLLLWGLVGARAVFILTKLPEYVRHPVEILMFWRGGLVWYGGFLAAVGYLAFFCRRYRVSFFKYVDLFIPFVALAHAMGRLGCLAAGCCFGEPTQMPWGIVFPVGSMAYQAQQAAGLIGLSDTALHVHPTQLYEAGAEIALFWLLTFWRSRKSFHGQLFLLWLTVYPVVRSVIELFRGDSERGVYVLSTSQYISIIVALAAVLMYVFYVRDRVRRFSRQA